MNEIEDKFKNLNKSIACSVTNTDDLTMESTTKQQELSKEPVEILQSALREIYEVWAGSEEFDPETAPEACQRALIHEMRDIAAEYMSKGPVDNKDGDILHTHFCYNCYTERFKHLGCTLKSNSSESTPSYCVHGKKYPANWKITKAIKEG